MPNVADIINGTQGANAIDLTSVMAQITDLLPVVLPVTIGFIAFRKGYAFLRGSLARS